MCLHSTNLNPDISYSCSNNYRRKKMARSILICTAKASVHARFSYKEVFVCECLIRRRTLNHSNTMCFPYDQFNMKVSVRIGVYRSILKTKRSREPLSSAKILFNAHKAYITSIVNVSPISQHEFLRSTHETNNKFSHTAYYHDWNAGTSLDFHHFQFIFKFVTLMSDFGYKCSFI